MTLPIQQSRLFLSTYQYLSNRKTLVFAKKQTYCVRMHPNPCSFVWKRFYYLCRLQRFFLQWRFYHRYGNERAYYLTPLDDWQAKIHKLKQDSSSTQQRSCLSWGRKAIENIQEERKALEKKRNRFLWYYPAAQHVPDGFSE